MVAGKLLNFSPRFVSSNPLASVPRDRVTRAGHRERGDRRGAGVPAVLHGGLQGGHGGKDGR